MPLRHAAAPAIVLALGSLCAGPLAAQPVDLPIPAATTQSFPAGIKVAKVGAGQVYADASGRVLYGMDMRVLQRFSPDPAQYCAQACGQE